MPFAFRAGCVSLLMCVLLLSLPCTAIGLHGCDGVHIVQKASGAKCEGSGTIQGQTAPGRAVRPPGYHEYHGLPGHDRRMQQQRIQNLPPQRHRFVSRRWLHCVAIWPSLYNERSVMCPAPWQLCSQACSRPEALGVSASQALLHTRGGITSLAQGATIGPCANGRSVMHRRHIGTGFPIEHSLP